MVVAISSNVTLFPFTAIGVAVIVSTMVLSEEQKLSQ